jgi:predicted component of type VI protein secretion system
MTSRFVLVDGETIVNSVYGGTREFLESHPDYQGYTVVDVSDMDPWPSVDWTYVDGEFVPPVTNVEAAPVPGAFEEEIVTEVENITPAIGEV